MLASLLPTLLLTFSEPGAEAAAPAAAPAASVDTSKRYVAPRQRDLGGYVGLRARPATLGRQYGSFMGFGGGLIFRRKLSLGLEVNAMSPEGPHQFEDSIGRDLTILNAYSGLRVGYMFADAGPLDFAGEVLVGGGSACSVWAYQDLDDGGCRDWTPYFVATPEVAMYINATKWLRLGISAGYRLVVADDWNGPSSRELGGFQGGLMVEVGKF